MVDYSKAKIYQILNDVDDDVYIGSTCQPLCKRMTHHRCCINLVKCKEYKIYKKMRDVGIEHFYIELIKEAPCENKEQLRAIEGQYIRQYGTLNTKIAGRTKKQHADDTKEHKAEYDKKRREEMGDELNQKKRETYWNDVENKREIRRQKYKENPQKYIQYQKQRVNCKICGKELSKGFMTEHLRTQHS